MIFQTILGWVRQERTMKKYVLLLALSLFCERGSSQQVTFSVPSGTPLPTCIAYLGGCVWTGLPYHQIAPGVYQTSYYGNWWSSDYGKWYLRFPDGTVWYNGNAVGDNTANKTTPQPGVADTSEPINVISGNNHFAVTGIAVPAPGIPLEFAWYYNSVKTNSSVLGTGWRNSYDWLLVTESNAVKIITRDAQIYTFPESGGVYEASADNNWQLSAQPNGGHALLLPGGITYRFDTNGVLQDISDDWNNTVSLTYSNGLLNSAEHNNGQALNFSYSNGLLSTVTAATNLSVSFAYSTNGALINAIRQAGLEQYAEAYSYSAALLLTQRVDAVGSDYHYTYEAGSGKATGLYLTTDRWYEHTVSYNTNRHSSSVVYQNNGATRSYDYDIDPFSSRILQERLASTFQKITYAYDGQGNVNRQTTYDANTNRWTQIYRLYDDRHNVTNEAFGLSATPTNITKYTWHPQWQTLTSVTDPEGFKTEYEYTNGAIAKELIWLSSNTTAETSYGYTTNGLLSAITNANGHATAFIYDTRGYLESVIPQAGATVAFGYDSLGHLTNSALPGGRQTGYTINPLGWVERIETADSLYETFQYNGLGKITNQVDRAGRVASYAYAPGGKLTAVSRQLGSTNVTVSYTFDQQFNTLAIRDELNRPVESYALDPQDRPTTVTNLEGQTMSIRYLVGDFVDSITRFDGTVVSNQYNGDGRLATVRYPGETNNYTYLKNGLVRTLENSKGSISNAWNQAGWLVAQRTQIGTLQSEINNTYDLVGNVTNSAVDFGGSRSVATAYQYDQAERLTEISQSGTGILPVAFSYAYNPDNGLVASVSNSNLRAEYQYDIMDRITSIGWKNAGGATIMSFDYQYNAVGMITNRILTGGSSSTSAAYQYDDLDRLMSETVAGGSSSTSTDYSYDLAGNRLAKQNLDSTVSYALGTGNRLASWSATSTNSFSSLRVLRVEGSSSESIGVDNRWGQLWVSNSVAVTPDINGTNFSINAFTVGLGTQTVVAAIRDQAGNVGYATNEIFLTVVTNGAYQYNAAGCVTNTAYSGTEYAQNISLKWNSQYQLTSVSSATSAVEYTYDVLGRRVSRTCTAGILPAEVEHYVYDGDQVVADLDGSGTILRSYAWGPGIDNLLALTTYGAETNTYYAVKDHLNTVHALVDKTGTIVERYEYDAWGRTTVFNAAGDELTKSAIGNRYCFQGREIDWTTGLYSFRARWYDPVSGRWLSKDPIGINGGLNQYVFCANNPGNFRDPLGDWEFYGNWGGPDWSGGREASYEYLSPAEIAANPPIDSMDELFFNHDKAYAEARCEQNKQLKHAKTKEERKAANATFQRLRQHADDILYRELARLPTNPGEWVRPAPDSKKAIRARSQAERFFRIIRNFYY